MHISKPRFAAVSRARPMASLPALPMLASAFAALVGCTVLLGWALDLDLLKSAIPGLVAMNPTTALSFVIAGLSLWLLDRNPFAPRARPVGLTLALAVALIGCVKFLAILTGWDIGLDQWMFHHEVAVTRGGLPNRMAPNTALAFFFIGLALACLHLEPRLDHRIAQGFALGTTVIASLAVIGYIYGVTALTGVTSYIHMALNTGLVFVALSVGILLARSRSGIVAVFTSEGPGGTMARAQLPVAILVPVALGWLRLKGQEMHLYNTQAGVSLGAVYSIYLSALLIWLGARALDRLDAERKRLQGDQVERPPVDDSTASAVGAAPRDADEG